MNPSVAGDGSVLKKRSNVWMPDFSVDCIIRIYRFKEDNPRHLVGVVQEVGAKGKKAFTNYDELWEILNAAGSFRRRVQRAKSLSHLNPKK